MRDGVGLAVDVLRPAEGERLPTVLTQGRYWRSFLARGQRGGPSDRVPPSAHHPSTEALVAAGFAVVNADVRGTGASEGAWPIPWSADERADAADLVEWIVRQPWSDGRVVAAGLSYEGTTAVLAAASGHPAVVGAVARGFEWEVYEDIVAPGGVVNEGFLREWSTSCADLDRGTPPRLFGWWRFLLKGPRPLDDDPDGAALAALQAARRGPTVWESARALADADAPFGVSGTSLAAVSLAALPALRGPGCAPLQLWGSWMDGTTARTVLRMWEAVPAVREAWIGAWSHTGEEGASLGVRGRPDPTLDAQVRTMLDFLRARVAGAPLAERRLHYYTMGEDRWHTTATWPPEGLTPRAWCLDATGALVDPPAATGTRLGTPDPRATTGRSNRWHTQNARPMSMPDRPERRLLVWRTEPLSDAWELTGEPELAISLTASYDRPAVFAYLDVALPDGRVRHLTEAQVRSPTASGVPGALTLRFLPTSALLPAGARLRLALAGTDADTFPQALPAEARWSVGAGPAARLEVPLRRR